jgi:hypothetical protein
MTKWSHYNRLALIEHRAKGGERRTRSSLVIGHWSLQRHESAAPIREPAQCNAMYTPCHPDGSRFGRGNRLSTEDTEDTEEGLVMSHWCIVTP